MAVQAMASGVSTHKQERTAHMGAPEVLALLAVLLIVLFAFGFQTGWSVARRFERGRSKED
ncbi:hypothetical protein [Amycolatopsis sp. CA-126428]|uniref:hypothetical protein n=1 Tax=Amycolatopsis sp. CA-126428 TaxID=2073158 RepID=UPI0011B00454|nr:hypothetical protein [Amycolatopsis sp. CA-126428]